jgi:hypothetical protein
MIQLRTLGILCLSLWASTLCGADLSQYRGLGLGSSVAAAAKTAGMEPSAATTIHQRPALIQELDWQPRNSYGQNYATEPVKDVVLSFYGGELYRMTARYDRFRTEGMTEADLTAAISQVYGKSTKPVAETLLIGSPAYPQAAEVLARWEDAQYSCNLVQVSGSPEFSMILLSKRLDGLAMKANAEAVKIEEQEAPERDAALQKSREHDHQDLLDKARLTNKASFRP